MNHLNNPLGAVADVAHGISVRLKTACSGASIGRTNPELALKTVSELRRKLEEIEQVANQEIARRAASYQPVEIADEDYNELQRRREELEKRQPKVFVEPPKRKSWLRKAA